jgi:hypothetical protein
MLLTLKISSNILQQCISEVFENHAFEALERFDKKEAKAQFNLKKTNKRHTESKKDNAKKKRRIELPLR